ncbi:MAG: type I restriction enzyme HsdR N-terminal domain-containing protein [Bacteroidota bacterium]|nr:type I restriction enzyme HsdR N-terminal domain-containing protein [Bacteroidota bacterium]
MIKLTFPKNLVKTRELGGVTEIFDAIRKKWLLLTPEEWVRQNVIHYLLVIKKYPAVLISVEKEIKLGELKKRCDLVVYNRNALPWMIIECKEMNVSLSQKTIEQILRYHITLPATFLIITNGSFSLGFQKIGNQFFEIDEFPEF